MAALKTDRLVITVHSRPEDKRYFELILHYETFRRIGPGLRNDPPDRQDLPRNDSENKKKYRR
jgi:hypothetical protein